MIDLILVLLAILLLVYLGREALTIFGWVMVGIIKLAATCWRKLSHTGN